MTEIIAFTTAKLHSEYGNWLPFRLINSLENKTFNHEELKIISLPVSAGHLGV